MQLGGSLAELFKVLPVLTINVFNKIRARARVRIGAQPGLLEYMAGTNIPTTSLPATLPSQLCGQRSCEGKHSCYGEVRPEFASHMARNVSVGVFPFLEERVGLSLAPIASL